MPPDAKSIGEVMFRGNIIMNGYLKNLKVIEDAFTGGWFRSGDLTVRHPDGYIELKDRFKDIIIFGVKILSLLKWNRCFIAILHHWRQQWWQGQMITGGDTLCFCKVEGHGQSQCR
ncbi:hypothetical protein V6N13_053924 [Hibiscus sabdariffa]|uniref:AMP-dependent synthetase/ligase domain-containing protein n=1 Tax=Hibiscus sabdariffa TaxID=183260 RepID=A0ABR2T6P1_9ROSI